MGLCTLSLTFGPSPLKPNPSHLFFPTVVQKKKKKIIFKMNHMCMGSAVGAGETGDWCESPSREEGR